MENLKVFKHSNVCSIKFDFNELGNKGVLTLIGELNQDKPTFKFILEK